MSNWSRKRSTAHHGPSARALVCALPKFTQKAAQLAAGLPSSRPPAAMEKVFR